jgi:hypothetical protein
VVNNERTGALSLQMESMFSSSRPASDSLLGGERPLIQPPLSSNDYPMMEEESKAIFSSNGLLDEFLPLTNSNVLPPKVA